MKINATNLACLMTAAILAEPCLASDPVTLRLALPEGFKAKVALAAKKNETIVVSPSPAHVTTDGNEHTFATDYVEENEYLIECVEVDTNAVMTIVETLTAKRTTHKRGDAALFEYDSRNDVGPDQPQAAVFAVQVNNPLTYRISPDGTVKEVIGVDAFVDRIEGDMRKASQPFPEDQKAIWRNRLLFSRPKGIPRFYPANSVDIGQSWVTPSFCSGKKCPPLDVASNTWTLQSVSNRIARLQIVSRKRSDCPASPGMTVLDSSIKMDGSSDMLIDLQTGLLLSSEITAENSSRIVFTRDGSDKQETTQQSGTTTVSLKTTFPNNSVDSDKE